MKIVLVVFLVLFVALVLATVHLSWALITAYYSFSRWTWVSLCFLAISPILFCISVLSLDI